MNKASKFTLSILISLGMFACNTQVPSLNSDGEIQSSSIDKNSGNISVNFAIPKSFSTKSIDLSKTTKLRLEVKSNDLTAPIMSEIVNYTAGQASILNVGVKAGKNRIVYLNFMDNFNNITGTLMGVTDVNAGSSSTVNINFFETALAQVMIGILNSANPNLLSTLSIDSVRNYLTNVTGFSSSNNSFSKINPSQLNTVLIAESIVQNNGALPSELIGLMASKDLTLNLNTSGVNVMINDLNSSSMINTSSNTVKINGVSYGRWKVTLTKDGYKTKSMDITVSDSSVSSIDLNLDNYFANYVSIGDSLTAGYQSGAVQKDKQLNSYPMLIARSGNVPFRDFKQPYISEPNTGYGFGGADAQGFFGELKADGSRFRLSLTSQSQIPSLLESLLEPMPYNNLGISGAKAEEIASTKASAANPFFGFVLRNRGTANDSSSLDQAIFKQPSLVTLWAGNNDVLGSATNGTSLGVTNSAQFQITIANMISRLMTQTTSDVFIATIPDVTSIPYTSTMIRKSFSNNDINRPIVDVPTGNPALPVIETAIATEESNVRYILINALGVIPSLTAGQKLEAKYTLTETEVAQLKDTVDSYNNTIKAQVLTNSRITLVDTNKLLSDVNLGLVAGASSKSHLLSANTMFSFDGVHPNSKGYRLVANEFIRVINKKYGFNLMVPSSDITQPITMTTIKGTLG